MTDGDVNSLRAAIDELRLSMNQAVVHIDYLKEALSARKQRFWAVVLGFSVPLLTSFFFATWWAAGVSTKLEDIRHLKTDISSALKQVDDRFRRADFEVWERERYRPLVDAIRKIHPEAEIYY